MLRGTRPLAARLAEMASDETGNMIVKCKDWAVVMSAEGAVRNAHTWFEDNSGWAPPDEDTLAEWLADDVCRCPDECLVKPSGWCRHGLASWYLILTAMEDGSADDRLRGV
ncbi:MAG: hypothetical protein QOE15_1809 [Acidimicrobiaceae bacterium]|nr:hypothetical protein [Acidimicrobiaceae bacterium]